MGEDEFLLNMFGNSPRRTYSWDEDGNLLEDESLLMTPMGSNGGIPSLPSNFLSNSTPSLNSIPTSSPRRAEDLSRITGEISSLQDQKTNALSELTKQGNLSSDNALAVALTAIVPTLIGLGFGGGLKGAATGATAGLAGANVGLQGLNADIAKRDTNNKLLYQDAVERLKAKESEASKLREGISNRAEELSDMLFQEQGKNQRSIRYANAVKPIDSPLGDSQLKDIDKYREAAQTGVNLLNTINTQFGSLLGNRYTKPDGSIDWQGVKAIGATKLGELIGADTLGSDLSSAIKEQISQFVKSISGTAASDEERAYLGGIVEGSGILPSSLPKIYQTVERIINNQAAQASGYIDLAVAARQKDPRASIMNSFPKAPTMGTGNIDLETSMAGSPKTRIINGVEYIKVEGGWRKK